jgi:uncharacterized membrane protein
MTQSTSAVNGNEAISYGWTSVKKDFWYFIALSVIVMIISSIGSSNNSNSFWKLIGFVLSILTTCGQLTIMLSYLDGKKLPLSKLFTSTQQFWRVLGASLLLAVVVIGGLILLIVPGVYFALKYQFVLNLIIDKKLGIGAAFRESSRITKGRMMALLGFNFLCLGVVLLGALCLGVGILVAMPVVSLADVFIYRHLQKTAPAATAAA